MRKLELNGNSGAELRRALRKCLHDSPEARYALRLQGLLFIASGLDCAGAARLLEKTPRTLERWIRLYQRHGLAGLRYEKKPGRWPAVDAEQLRTIRADLERAPRTLGYPAREWSGNLLARHLRQNLDIALSERQGQRLLRQLQGNVERPRDATLVLSHGKG